MEPQPLLLVGFAASFAAKLADTFGSEIGKRWGRRAVLITTLRPVPPGTEGPSAWRDPRQCRGSG